MSSDRDVGYLASNTLAGSRLNTPLRDTAASISVFTSEFLSDIGAFDISEAMNYAVYIEYQRDDDRATTPNGNKTVGGYQGYRIRGLTASVAQNYNLLNSSQTWILSGRPTFAAGPASATNTRGRRAGSCEPRRMCAKAGRRGRSLRQWRRRSFHFTVHLPPVGRWPASKTSGASAGE